MFIAEARAFRHRERRGRERPSRFAVRVAQSKGFGHKTDNPQAQTQKSSKIISWVVVHTEVGIYFEILYKRGHLL